MTKIFLIFLFIASSAFAIEEANIPTKFQQTIIPFYESVEIQKNQIDDKNFTTYKVFENPGKPIVVYTPGQGESLIKYAELAYDLVNMGYEVVFYNHRNQGQSSRQTKNREITYIESFDI